VQECASGLYDALQAGWKCQSDHWHPANIQLEVWSPHAEGESDELRLEFSFLFADDAEQARHDHWMTAEISHFADKSRLPVGQPLHGSRAGKITTCSGMGLSDDSYRSLA